MQKESVRTFVSLCFTLCFFLGRFIFSNAVFPNYRCLKLYCQCFALSSTCGPKCKCQTCHNTTLHAEAIKEARKNILERNPNAFDDKFRGSPTSSPFRPGVSPAISSWQPVYSNGSAPSQALSLNRKPSRVNKFGCKCRRSFCLKKVRLLIDFFLVNNETLVD